MVYKFKRNDLIQYISAQAEITVEQAQQSISALVEAVGHILQHRNKVCLKKFGIFTVKETFYRTRDQHVIENIDRKFVIKRLHFKASPELHKIVNQFENK